MPPWANGTCSRRCTWYTKAIAGSCAMSRWGSERTIRTVHIEQLIDQGVALGKQGLFEQAAAMLRDAVAASPQHPRAHANLAVALQALARYDDALVACRRAVELWPDQASPHHTLANILIKLNRVSEAIAALRQWLARQPNSAQAHR